MNRPAKKLLITGAATLVIAAAVRLTRGTRRGSVAQTLRRWINPHILLERTLVVNRPVEDVYSFWRDFSNFPRFMSYIRSVEIGTEGKLRWSAQGPAGIPVSWQSQLGALLANQRIEWDSDPTALIRNSGEIRFDDLRGRGTRVRVCLAYSPPAGALGLAAAGILGFDPRTRIDSDLLKMKSLIETSLEVRQARRQVPGFRSAG